MEQRVSDELARTVKGNVTATVGSNNLSTDLFGRL
tara:strand:+ start:4423 stop:4527 length:105 start_codon:yes stop_codon:yes gene_type:complete